MENPKGYANPELLIEPSDLAGRLGRAVAGATGTGAEGAGPVLLDLRPAEAFAAGHIPGAAHLDLFGLSLIDTDPAPLRAFLWTIAHLLTSRGVDASRPVVVYDEQSGIRAARAFWFLEFFGHPDARLLDGGFGAWERAGLPATRAAEAPAKGAWEVGGDDARLATWRQVSERLDRPDVAILDTRSDAEYCGTLVRARRGGAIPGAVHIEWTRNLDEAGGQAASIPGHVEASGSPRDKGSSLLPGGTARPGYVALRLLAIRASGIHRIVEGMGDRETLPDRATGMKPERQQVIARRRRVRRRLPCLAQPARTGACAPNTSLRLRRRL